MRRPPGRAIRARERARTKLEEPDPLPGIAPATEERSRLFDPAITVARDIRTPDGTLIAAAGTRVNPLERIALARDLLFVDGRQEAEIAWALARQKESGRPSKIVLLAGRPLDLMRRHRRPFFFDQGGAWWPGSGSGSRRAWSNRMGRNCALQKSRSRACPGPVLGTWRMPARRPGQTPKRRTDPMLNVNRATLLGHAGREPEGTEG